MLRDGEVVLHFLMKERGWTAQVEELQHFHQGTLGRKTQAVRWHHDGRLGAHCWLGFFWEKPAVWFGLGLRYGAWLPVIDAQPQPDNEELFGALRKSLPKIWDDPAQQERGCLRLWAPAACEGEPALQASWMRERSREVSEFGLGA